MKDRKRSVLGLAGSAFLSFCFASALPSMAQDSNVAKTTGQVNAEKSQERSSELPDSPSTTLAQASNQSQTSQTPSQQQEQTLQATQQGQPAQAPARQQEPVGTAAAEAPKTTGVAASQPAGLAIAPAKQRRARKIIIRTGAIIGAGIAVGTVIALTEATSSKPPGAR